MVFDDSNVIRTSVGVGLIWASPFGPLRFDYAIPITKGKYDRRAGVQVRRRNFVLSLTTGRTATDGMAQPTFFEQPPSSTLAEIAALTKAHLVDPSRGGQQVRGLASLDEAGPMHLTFFDNLKYADQLASTKAGACLVSERFEATVPAHVAVLRAAHPFRAFVKFARELHAATPFARNPGSAPAASRRPPSSTRPRIWKTT